MGACCSKGDRTFDGFILNGEDDFKESDVGNEDRIPNGDFDARVRLQGSCKDLSMFTQQGRKGINQDAMTVWENFTGEKDMFFCGVFDGHGPSGHKVARQVRDILPSKLSHAFKKSKTSGNYGSGDVDEAHNNDGNGDFDNKDGHDENTGHNSFFSLWKTNLIKSFKEIDDELCADASIDSYCSGTTAVTIIKQGNHLVIANLGDSRAVLCTRGNKNQPVSVQLTVDMKPNLPCEAERIRDCKGRVFAMDEEPEVFRVWMPDDNCPGLAMARAFGDFCLKDFGLISIPEVSYRKLTDTDEFVVLATDGVWDVLTNNEVVEIVASAKKRHNAARVLVDRAVRAWRCKYPCSKIDDCAVICLFLKPRLLLTKSTSERSHQIPGYPFRGLTCYSRSMSTEDRLTVINDEITTDSKDCIALSNVARVDSIVKVPRLETGLNHRRKCK
ncbi:probable protein phosphatase 2C 65 [Cornus florida]|uniref:probable protein phosphatase 2C 65 n=1 Tax=Cornus florida TaxID=4283 RepID=UPI002898C163|nr:probable protein phosphatase 2C 65 [Cornus florida]